VAALSRRVHPVAVLVEEVNALLRSPKLLFQFAKIHLNDGWTTVRTGVRHLAMAEVFNKVFQLSSSKRVVGFNSVAADRLGDSVLPQTQRIDFLARCFQFIHQFQNKSPRVRRFDEWWQSV